MADISYASKAATVGARHSFWGVWLAFAACAVFFAFQLLTINYGTRINDLAHIRDHQIEKIDIDNSALNRAAIAVSNTGGAETLDRWMLRYKLYSIEADEVVNVMALARINPAFGQFDPHFYQYGGAFLYPLGGWFYASAKLGLLPLGSLDVLLADPDRMDKVYAWGRAFVLAAFTLSGFVLFLTLRMVARPSIALAGTGIYLFCPASIMFSVVMKPHWYALLYVTCALFLVVSLFERRKQRRWEECALALCLGLAVGSVTTLGLFAALVWCALFVAVARGLIDWVPLVRVPASSLAVYALSNPFALVNWRALAIEGESAAGWYAPSIAPTDLWAFVENSFLPGFGVGFGLLLLFVLARELARPSFAGARGIAAALGLALALAAVVTAAHSVWHTNLRYVPYVLPAGLLLLAASRHVRISAFAVALMATLVQSVPTKLAYVDENDPEHSTRLLAGAWIDANLPSGSGVCLPTLTPTPYDVPPFDLARFAINAPGCAFRVVIEREGSDERPDEGFAVMRRFRPRLSPDWLPGFTNHVNPQITIYRRAT